jgi:molybdopterin-guanine dinucleotide biosynthesis protein A
MAIRNDERAAAILVAGGRSERMGDDKALMPLGEKPLVQWVFDALQKVFDTVIVAASRKEQFSFLGAHVVPDRIANAGPLAGLHAGLLHLDAPCAFASGCDTPFLQEEFLRFMRGEYRGEEALVPVVQGKVQPLHGIYAKCAASRMEAFAQEGRHGGVHKFLEKISTRYLRDDAVDFSRFADSFLNVNTPQALCEAEARAGRK